MVWRAWASAMGLAVLLVLGAPDPASSCSTVAGYVRPSNFELVQIADTIVVAQAVGAKEVRREDFFNRKVVFHVSEALKGDASGDIEVSGLSLGRTRPSDPQDILAPHPEAYMGACNRTTMSKSATYVLFLRRTDKGYATLGYPFSRINEDYAGEASPWMKTIRTYLRLQASAAPMDQLATLERMRAEILSRTTASRDDQALATDIETHLAAPSPWKPTPFLLAAYDDLKAGRPPRFKPRDPAFDAEQSEAASLADLIMKSSGFDSGKAPAPPRRDPRQTALLEMLIEGEHPTALPIFEAFAAPDAPSDDLAMALRFYARNGRYADAYALIETRVAPLIATAPEDEARFLLRTIGKVQQDPFYGDGPPRWRSDPAIAARWPALALKLTMISEDRFGDDPGYTETLKGLLGADYRANPDLTFILSGQLNEIGDWAEAELARKDNLAASTGGPDDPLRLPLRIVLRWIGLSGTDEDLAKLKPAFCRGGAQRRMLFETWGRDGGTSGSLAILQLGASPVLDAADRRQLAAAVPAWDRRYVADSGKSWLQTDAAMQKLAQGQAIGAKDIKPLKPVTCP